MNQVQGHQNHGGWAEPLPTGQRRRLCWAVVPALGARPSMPAQQRGALKAAVIGTKPQRVAVNDSERCCGASWRQASGGNRCQPKASRVPCAPAPNRRRGRGGGTSPRDSAVRKGWLCSRAEPRVRHGAPPLRRPSENQFAWLNRQRFGFEAVIALRAAKEPSTSSHSGKGTLSYGREPGGDLPFRLNGGGEEYREKRPQQ